MDCKHNWKIGQTDSHNGGYMIIKFCVDCKTTEGTGFVSAEHEMNYLNSMLKT